MQNRIQVFLIAAKLLDVNPENAIVLKILFRPANIGKMTSIGIGEESLYEAKYVFNFTHIEKELYTSLIN
jgi:hypothetical protein